MAQKIAITYVFLSYTWYKYSNHSKKQKKKIVPGNVQEIKLVRILYIVISMTFNFDVNIIVKNTHVSPPPQAHNTLDTSFYFEASH